VKLAVGRLVVGHWHKLRQKNGLFAKQAFTHNPVVRARGLVHLQIPPPKNSAAPDYQPTTNSE
jgi:hypothetical protein